MPSALAVLRLTTISNLVGCTMGRFGWFLAPENQPNIDPALAIAVGKTRSVANKAARRGEFFLPIHHRDGVSRRKRNKLIALGAEERIVRKDNGVDLPLLNGREGIMWMAASVPGAGEHERSYTKFLGCRR